MSENVSDIQARIDHDCCNSETKDKGINVSSSDTILSKYMKFMLRYLTHNNLQFLSLCNGG